MARYNILIAALVMLSLGWMSVGGAAAQTAPSTTGGVKFGLNVANLVENTERLDSKNGFVLGGFVRYDIDDVLSVQPEVLFSKQGASIRDRSIHLDYLQIPVLVVAGVRKQQVRPFVLAGPALGLRLRATAYEDDESEDLSEIARRSDMSFVLGGGIERKGLVVEARYTWGLLDLDTGRDIDKNRVFSLMAGFNFGAR